MYKINKNIYLFLCLIIISTIFTSCISPQALASDTDEIEVLNQEVDEKKSAIDLINSQINAYKSKISAKQAQIQTLEEQTEVIENRIAKAELDITVVRMESDALNLEISLLEKQIDIKEQEIDLQKSTLAKVIRRINKLDQRTYLEVLLANDSFSEFFDQLKYVEDIQSDLQGLLTNVQSLKTNLEDKKSKRETKKEQLEQTRLQLEQEQADLTEELALKDIFIKETESSESIYQQFVAELREEQQYIDNQIAHLEESIRKKIEAMDQAFEDNGGGDQVLSWPLDPSRGITAYFHDPTYPFRHLFEHPGIDLRAYQGTPVKAAAPGYVVWAKQGNLYGNYVMIAHAGGLSTIYAHLSQINVHADQFVERGQVIGLSGGMPGTPGCGLSTGPHLHFELRSGGIPVNPLNYLIDF
ncbi:DUF4026 domain-containing protein [Patescibacteria group bacterium]|nr:DUF4026 domain-containing protein [Patescibacteria group bacterium]MBU1921603.1 DUF4026 domain-containing protein [Patescibacteria group bacterium]